MTGRILVVAKAPMLGRVKTRLAATVGQDRALALATAFLADTLALVDRVGGARGVLATTDGFQVPGEWPVWDQGGGGLGERLDRLARRALADAPWVVLLGADSPGLPLALLRAACDAAIAGKAAWIPAADGGFVALALPACPPGLFDGIPWSTAETGAAMAAACVRAGLDVVELPAWFDVDTEADLERLRRDVAPEDAAVTFLVL